ncbi:putative transmembrane protein, partial [Rhizoctonia solani 123E]
MSAEWAIAVMLSLRQELLLGDTLPADLERVGILLSEPQTLVLSERTVQGPPERKPHAWLAVLGLFNRPPSSLWSSALVFRYKLKGLSTYSYIMVAISLAVLSAVAGALIRSVQAAPSPTITHVDEFVRRDAEAPPFVKRAASCTFPSPPKTSSLSAPITVTGTFDG